MIPTELWEYSLADAARGIGDALVAKRPERVILPDLGEALPARSGRAALLTLLQALGLPKGSRVGVPLFCCEVVFDAIIAAELSPLFIDVDPSTLCLSFDDVQRKASQVDALFVVHAFGSVCDVPSLQEILPGKPIIEDCAQALGSTWNDRPVGILGSAAIFSFRSGKYLSVGEGGALLMREAYAQARAARLLSKLPAPSAAAEIMHVIKTWLRSLLRRPPWYGIIGRKLWDRVGRHAASAGFPNTQGFRTDFALVRRRLLGLPDAIGQQRAMAEQYLRLLQLPGRMLLSEPPGAFSNRYQFPIIFDSKEQRDTVADRLQRNGVQPITPWSNAVSVARARFDYRGDCPMAEDLCERVMTIPSHHRLSSSVVADVAATINRAWSDFGDARGGDTGLVGDGWCKLHQAGSQPFASRQSVDGGST